jgi:hypothetical protein
MRVINKVLAGTAAIGIAATMTACSSSGGDSKKPVGEFKTLSGNSTTVVLDPGFIQAITSLKVTPAPIGRATLAPPNVTFPITGGNAKIYKKGDATPYVQGSVEHKGSGLSLAAGGHTVKLTDFVVDPGTSHLTGKVSANGKTVVKSAPLFTLDGRSLKPLKVSGNHAILAGTKVKLRKEAADLLNKTFKVTAFKDQFLIGVATITLNLK